MQETWVGSLVRKIPREGNGNPFKNSYLENPMDRGAWWATVCGVAKSGTWLSDWACMNSWWHLSIKIEIGFKVKIPYVQGLGLCLQSGAAFSFSQSMFLRPSCIRTWGSISVTDLRAPSYQICENWSQRFALCQPTGDPDTPQSLWAVDVKRMRLVSFWTCVSIDGKVWTTKDRDPSESLFLLTNTCILSFLSYGSPSAQVQCF